MWTKILMNYYYYFFLCWGKHDVRAKPKKSSFVPWMVRSAFFVNSNDESTDRQTNHRYGDSMISDQIMWFGKELIVLLLFIRPGDGPPNDSVCWPRLRRANHSFLSLLSKPLLHLLFCRISGPSTQCTPDACENAGKCVQQWNSFTCDCDTTSYTGPRCADGKQMLFWCCLFPLSVAHS